MASKQTNRQLIKKVFITFLVRGFGALAGFLLTLTVARTLNPDEAGQFLFGFTLIQIIGMLLTLGGIDAVLKIVGANEENNWPLINSSLNATFTWSIFLGGIVSAALTVFNKPISLFLVNDFSLSNYLPIIGLSSLAFAIIQLVSAAHQGKHHTVTAALIQNLTFQFSFILLVGLVVTATGVITAFQMFQLLLATLLLAALAGLKLWYSGFNAKPSIKFALTDEIKTAAPPLFVLMLMNLAVQWASQLAAGKLLDFNEVAMLAAAQRTALLASFVLLAVNLVVAPKFANAFKKRDLSHVNHLSLLSSRLMVALATPVLLLMLTFPEFLMGFFGAEYVKAAVILQILAVGQFINVVTGSVGYLLNMTNHEKDMRNLVLLSGSLAIVLAFTLTELYGLQGAAYATAISVATQNLLAVVMVKRRLGFNTLNLFRAIN